MSRCVVPKPEQTAHQKIPEWFTAGSAAVQQLREGTRSWTQSLKQVGATG